VRWPRSSSTAPALRQLPSREESVWQASHAEFYPVYCGFSVDTEKYPGTTRKRFIAILESLAPGRQAIVLRGVLQRFQDRDQDKKDELLRIINRLEGGPVVPSLVPRVSSDIVKRALSDAENLLRNSGPVSAVDRVHTALHGYLRAVCEQVGVADATDASITALFKLLRGSHPKLADETGTQLLFRLVAAGYERRSLGLASHWPFEDWGTFLPVPSTAAALLDRLLHHAIVVVTSGESWRLKEARSRAPLRTPTGTASPPTTSPPKEDQPTP
jgi:hypothetical protein